ncbi:hypothetical protein [Pantoea sp. SORGH_AS_0659]|uniref:hypothetical protein n=1 Tax=Pantoea sp. SORGH_AS_0659 TaxID=3062597 RepID=UPI00285ACD62|nr:hypothetical protein [Pantoea sp. SORGH_AS_0659]MDR6352458.1 hypothetical protein [Pantoea sp. SORGH_AS_0659]
MLKKTFVAAALLPAVSMNGDLAVDEQINITGNVMAASFKNNGIKNKLSVINCSSGTASCQGV